MLFDLRTSTCPCCKRQMMPKMDSNFFPLVESSKQEYQMRDKGVFFISKSRLDAELICSDCESKGKATFECALCQQRHNSDQIQESFGDPAEFLCKTCYSTVPAKTWNEKVDCLEKHHRYYYI